MLPTILPCPHQSYLNPRGLLRVNGEDHGFIILVVVVDDSSLQINHLLLGATTYVGNDSRHIR
jgi:hypothetical protein